MKPIDLTRPLRRHAMAAALATVVVAAAMPATAATRDEARLLAALQKANPGTQFTDRKSVV